MTGSGRIAAVVRRGSARRGRALALGAGAVLAAGCAIVGGDGGSDLRAELERNERTWREKGVADYDVTLNRNCFCPPDLRGPVVVAVRDGEIAARTYVESGEPVGEERGRWFPDVDGLFEFVADAIDRDARRIDVAYDAEYGYPGHVFVDYDERIADEEVGYDVLGFEPAL